MKIDIFATTGRLAVVAEQKGQAAGVQRAAGTVGFFTLISRILGFLRDILTAAFLGAGFFSDAFFVAFRIPNLFRRLFGEGSLTVAFVPIFTQELVERGEAAAKQFMRSTFTWLLLLLLFLVLVGEVFAKPVAWLFAAGFSSDKLETTTQMLRIVFPYILFISLVALSMGVLNSLKHFSSPAFSPVLLNLAMISSLLLSFWLPLHPAYCLAGGVIVGGMLQLALQLYVMARRRFHYKVTWKKPSAEVKELASIMFPSVFGAAAYQLNLLINTQLASRLQEGSVSFLYYADRLVEFPLGVVAVALGTAILPFLSRQAAEEDFAGLKATLRDGLKSLYLLIFPATVGLVVLRLPLIDLLFHRRAFSYEDARMTAFALLFGALGMVGVGTVRVVVPVFYAFKDMWTPFKVSLVTLGCNLTLALLLMGPLRHGGLALAVSLASSINALLLMGILRRRLGRLGVRQIVVPLVKMAVAALLMGLFLYTVVHRLGWHAGLGANRLLSALQLLATIVTGAGIYFILCRLMHLHEAKRLFALLGEKLLGR